VRDTSKLKRKDKHAQSTQPGSTQALRVRLECRGFRRAEAQDAPPSPATQNGWPAMSTRKQQPRDQRFESRMRTAKLPLWGHPRDIRLRSKANPLQSACFSNCYRSGSRPRANLMITACGSQNWLACCAWHKPHAATGTTCSTNACRGVHE